MSWFKRKDQGSSHSSCGHAQAPPEWTPAPEIVHAHGLYNEAPEEEYEAAEAFCITHPVEAPRLLPSDVIERIDAQGCSAWGIQWPASQRFVGRIDNDSKTSGTVKISTDATCKGTCLLSDLPIAAGLYEIQGKAGVYFEVAIHQMDGIIALGTSCRPYPDWRFPGWNRLSAALHLDDCRKFFEDPDGGRDYTDILKRVSPGDTIGCGYEFSTHSVFFTYNGIRLPNAFSGVYLPRQSYDVYAAVGVEGRNSLEVNFGGCLFRWKEGNEWAWRVEGHVGRLGATSGAPDDELPSYDDVRRGMA
ncbi:hypothetical protein GLOTRDRAFT_116475 [Gloeophyllum trabeum ATCC 11539]|uniref:B30.2/SPRY domain-containing protein n=1 Tax=Gloeophyllum trabeum (strain ATCC 11539 / FP-39264 / Madison 617) TaxID=670483 RepID=S7Q553_GLOTA|nr:uncharacterized protein GLOTRDRAFT_116475 [Gloeophyllum trabeum ATCC 11539]EPQ54637.1 hypothetical protein GLOTRDRAFT_116475 [Gloeophyllum trabeum ATCC 11539]